MIMLGLVTASISMSSYSFYRTLQAPQAMPLQVPPAHIFETRMGIKTDTHILFAEASVNVTNTAEKFSKDNYLMLFVRVPDNTVDPGLDTVIDRSTEFDIGMRAVSIEVQIKKGAARLLTTGRMDLYLVMVPKTLDPAGILKINDVLQHGGKLLDSRGMSGSPEELSRHLQDLMQHPIPSQ